MPGESLICNADIDNKSSRDIKEMSVSLVQNIRFIATTKSKIVRRVVSNIMFPNMVKEKSFQDWNNIILPIPSICSTSNGVSKIIEVNYFVIFNFDTSGIAVSKDLTIPITIGTIPLRDDVNSVPSTPLPYSFERCMFGPNTNLSQQEEIKGEYYENDSNTYIPLYPIYNDYSIANSKF